MDVIDSHTEGEPTRLILQGGPKLGAGCLLRNATNSPGGSIRIVGRQSSILADLKYFFGALLCEPSDSNRVTGVIF